MYLIFWFTNNYFYIIIIWQKLRNFFAKGNRIVIKCNVYNLRVPGWLPIVRR